MGRENEVVEERGIRAGEPSNGNEQLVLDLFGVYSWTELYERAGEIELVQAFLATHLINWNAILRLSLREQAGKEENKREFIRRAARKWGLTESAVRHYVYD